MKTYSILSMSSKINLLKLNKPVDIDECEMIFTHRQKLIEDKLLNCYADEIAAHVECLVVENCNGCIIDHPSQRQRPCLI